jgi:ubiquinone/menaquinone biosynthesis C-methylase UbiE
LKSIYKSEKFWDRIAKYFDWVEKKDEPINLKIIEKTKNLLNSTYTVLDFGCGSGTAAMAIASSVKEINGIDISSKMIELAKGKLKNTQFGILISCKQQYLMRSYKRDHSM